MKYPINEARSLTAIACCASPKIHVHDVENPCERCFDAEHPIQEQEETSC